MATPSANGSSDIHPSCQAGAPLARFTSRAPSSTGIRRLQALMESLHGLDPFLIFKWHPLEDIEKQDDLGSSAVPPSCLYQAHSGRFHPGFGNPRQGVREWDKYCFLMTLEKSKWGPVGSSYCIIKKWGCACCGEGYWWTSKYFAEKSGRYPRANIRWWMFSRTVRVKNFRK